MSDEVVENPRRSEGRRPAGPSTGRRVANVAAVALAVVLQLGVGWFTAASGLIAPIWAVVTLAVVWLMAVLVMGRLVRRAPLATVLVPVVNAAVWWGAMTAGDVLLGWTA